ncbi:MAG: hypothetical protein KAS32_10980 [Candidatus Peribacteraceae bacterium]|nr:hypothetical protein [Candidatus Peribacteraceae bacterium]
MPDQQKYYDNDTPRGPDLRRVSSHGKTKTGSWVVEEIWEMHDEVVRRIVLGQKNTVIAEALSITAQQVSNIRNSPVIKDKIQIMRAARDAGTVDLSRQIAEMAPAALENIKSAVEDGVVNGKELSASEILKESNTVVDRTIGKPTQTLQTKNLHAHYTADDIERIKKRANKMAEENGMLGEAI